MKSGVSQDVLDYVRNKKSFSTQQVADHFGIRSQQAAARIAILRLKEVVEPAPAPAPTSKDQSSRWTYVGK